MNVKQLREKLEKYPDDMIIIAQDSEGSIYGNIDDDCPDLFCVRATEMFPKQDLLCFVSIHEQNYNSIGNEYLIIV